ncbi:MAG TPA: hypothetical protein PLB62_01270 [Candidatus Sumerlaeota bacterium]|nr:hypothetical protein [Candidatus Sumerlaeota bacterium]
MTLHKTKSQRRSRGSILVSTFLICSLAAIATVWMVRTLLDHQHTNRRRRDLKNAYFAAQSGVSQVIQWGNHPEEYDNLGPLGLFYRDMTTGEFPNLVAALQSGAEYAISQDRLTAFVSSNNTDVATISEIVLIAADPANDPVPCLFKVRSEGVTPSGASRRILAYLQPNPIDTTEVALGAGVISLATIAVNGNANVHWGEAWSRQPLNLPSLSHSGNLKEGDRDYDPFAKYRTESYLSFDSTWKEGVNKPIYEKATRRFPGAAPATGDFEKALEQFIPEGVLDWPDFKSKYQDFKDHALSHGRYYGTDANGNIYRDGIKEQTHLVDFNTEFGEADRANSPYDLVFIDTIDGNPPTPADNPANIATIRNTGTGLGMKGIFYVCANMYQGGSGNPADLVAEKPVLNPDGTVSLDYYTIPKVYLDGVLYASGTVDYQGNPVIYGSVITEQGFVGGGTPDVYYNPRLKDGLQIPRGNIGSVFQTRLQKNF